MVAPARLVIVAASATAGVVVAAEVAHVRAARRAQAPRRPGARYAIVVLGYPTRADGSPHPLQRWRVAIALRTLHSVDAQALVFCGGAVANGIAEADTMAGLAIQGGAPASLVHRERVSRTTKENVARARELVDDDMVVLLASDPLHATRARRHWVTMYPDDAGRVFLASTYRPFEHWPRKVASAAYELGLAVGARGMPKQTRESRRPAEASERP